MTFNEFWAQYPRKSAKLTAARAFAKVAQTDHVAVLSGLEKAKASRQWQEGVIPHASTWLNQRRWEDEAGPQDQGPTKAQRYLAEYRRRTGWWCRHVPTCETLEDCDERVLKRWRERGII